MRAEIVKAKTLDPKRQVWMWRFRTSNGRVIASAETYDNFQNAKRGAMNAVRAIVKGDPKFRVASRVPSVEFAPLDWKVSYFVLRWTTE